MNTLLNQLHRLLVEIDSLAGSVEVTGSFRESRQCAEKARSRTAKAIKIVAELDAQTGQVPEGWKLVPIEPLTNMMSDKDHDTRIMAERQLLAMLAAAPAQGGE